MRKPIAERRNTSEWNIGSNSVDNFDKLSDENKRIVLGWIGRRLEPKKPYGRRAGRSSYGLKHVMEREIGLYINNGAMKGAMRVAGFKVWDDNGMNWYYELAPLKPLKGDGIEHVHPAFDWKVSDDRQKVERSLSLDAGEGRW